MSRDDYYINEKQQKSLEDVIVFLVENKKSDYIQPIIDLMRISENWYGRLEELRAIKAPKVESEE